MLFIIYTYLREREEKRVVGSWKKGTRESWQVKHIIRHLKFTSLTSKEWLPKLDKNINNWDTIRHIFSYCPLKHKKPPPHFQQSTQEPWTDPPMDCCAQTEWDRRTSWNSSGCWGAQAITDHTERCCEWLWAPFTIIQRNQEVRDLRTVHTEASDSSSGLSQTCPITSAIHHGNHMSNQPTEPCRLWGMAEPVVASAAQVTGGQQGHCTPRDTGPWGRQDGRGGLACTHQPTPGSTPRPAFTHP